VADEEYESEHDENWKRENAKLIEEDDKAIKILER